jgi:hypothetical protein
VVIIDRIAVRNIYHTYRLIYGGCVNELASESKDTCYIIAIIFSYYLGAGGGKRAVFGVFFWLMGVVFLPIKV